MFQRFARVRLSCTLCVAALVAVSVVPPAAASEAGTPSAPSPTPREQVADLEAMCAANSEAMAARRKVLSLYERLGGEKKIREIVAEVVRLHGVNEPIKHLLEGVDQAKLIDSVSQFLIVGSGGPGEYTGRNMVDAHAHLKLTNADFLAAGGDIMQAMKNKGCEEPEIQEVVCTLVSLREHVVIDAEKTLE